MGITRSFPPCTTGWVSRNEQCVCHRGSKSRASRRTTYELECRAEGREASRETIMKRRAQVLYRDALVAEIEDLSKASVMDLRERWKTLYGKEPSNYFGRSFMTRTIAYRLQERAFGGLKPSTQRVLDRIGASRSEAAPEPTPKRRASAGTVLIREWRGVSHRVTVLDHDV